LRKEGTVPEFYRRVLTTKEVIEKAFGGPIPRITSSKPRRKYKESVCELTTDDRAKTFVRYFAYILITRSCKAKLGSLIKRLEETYHLKDNKYPKVLLDTKDMLASHVHDKPDKQDKSPSKQSSSKENQKTTVSPERVMVQLLYRVSRLHN
jgi:hypothetical protein